MMPDETAVGEARDVLTSLYPGHGTDLFIHVHASSHVPTYAQAFSHAYV